MLSLTELSECYKKRLVANGMVNQNVLPCLRKIIDFIKSIILTGLIKQESYKPILAYYCENTEDVCTVWLGISTTGNIDDFYFNIIETAQDEINDTGTAKLYTVNEKKEDLERIYKNGFEKGIEIDWLTFNNFFKITTKQLIVLTGMAGAGKSTWLDNYLMHLAYKREWKTCFYSPENFPIEYHIEKLLSIHQQKPFFSGISERITPAEMDAAREWVNKYFYFISSDDNVTLDVLLNLFKRAIEQYGVNCCVLDPWNTIEHRRAKDQNETDYICECLTKCLGFTRRKNVSIIIVAHPSKMRRDKDGTFPAPTPYDIHGSAHWANRPDVSITIHRQKDCTEAIINKVRFRMYGQTGICNFKFDPVCNSFTEIHTEEGREKENDLPF